jgi:hypothetical protein
MYPPPPKVKAGFPLRPYRTEMYWWACADWKEVYKPTYFRVYSRIKIKSSSQVNFLVYYGSTNQSTFTKFWNLKTFLIRFGTVHLKWKTGLTICMYTVHMYQCIYKLWLHDSSNFALHYITTKLLSKHCIKRLLDTGMNGHHCFNFTEKTFLQSVNPKQHICQIFTLIYHLTFPKGMGMTFHKRYKHLRGGMHPSPQNMAM